MVSSFAVILALGVVLPQVFCHFGGGGFGGFDGGLGGFDGGFGGFDGGLVGFGGGPGFGGFPGFGGSSSSNALGGGQINAGNINSDNTAFTNGGSGFAHGNTNAQGFGANIFSVASSNSFGRRRRSAYPAFMPTA